MISTDSKIDESVTEKLEAQTKEHISYKHHDGIMKRQREKLPSRLIKAMTILMESK